MKLKNKLRLWLFRKEWEAHNLDCTRLEDQRKRDFVLKKAMEVVNSQRRVLSLDKNYIGESDYVMLFIYYAGFIHENGRRRGNTTRLIDMAIQFFFMFGRMRAEWFLSEGMHRDVRQHAFKIFRERLSREHSFNKSDLEVDNIYEVRMRYGS